MSKPTNREEFIDWCLGELGHPVIEINVDEKQIDDAVDDALSYFQDFHSDGTERVYLKYQITDQDKTNQYVPVSNAVIGITRVFPLTGGAQAMNMFDLRYQMRLHDLWSLTSTSFINYVMIMQHVRMIDMLFNPETPVRYNRHTDKLYIDWDWENKIQAGEWIIVEAYVVTNPEAYTKVWNDRLLKKLATAYIKKRWGQNMSKFDNMQLPGGVKMRGVDIYNEAVREITELENLIRLSHEPPPMMMIG